MKDNKFFKLENYDLVDEGSKGKSTAKYCKQCKTKNEKDVKFCIECGHTEFYNSLKEMNEENFYKYCVKCNLKVRKSTKFCTSCGCEVFNDSPDAKLLKMESELDKKYRLELEKISKKIDECSDDIATNKKNNDDLKKKIDKDKKTWMNKLLTLKEENQLLDESLLKKQTDIENYNKKVSDMELELSNLRERLTFKENPKLDSVSKKIKEETNKVSNLTKKYNILKSEAEEFLKLDEEKTKKLEAKRKAEERETALRLAKEAEEKKRKEEELKAKLEQEAKEKEEKLRMSTLFEETKRIYETRNYQESFKKFKELVDLGHKESYGYFGLHHLFGYGTLKSISEAKIWFNAAPSNDSNKYLGLGLIKFYSGSDKSSRKEAFELIEKSGKKNNGLAYYYMGICYEKGYGVKKNKTKAASYYRLSSEYGCVEASVLIGTYYVKGKLVKKDLNKASGYFNAAVKRGDATAMNELGQLYRQGINTKNPSADARKMFEKAIELGNLDALYNLACCIDGIGKENPIPYYEDAAKKGHKKAQLFMMKLYKNGNSRYHISPNKTESDKWKTEYKKK